MYYSVAQNITVQCRLFFTSENIRCCALQFITAPSIRGLDQREERINIGWETARLLAGNQQGNIKSYRINICCFVPTGSEDYFMLPGYVTSYGRQIIFMLLELLFHILR